MDVFCDIMNGVARYGVDVLEAGTFELASQVEART